LWFGKAWGLSWAFPSSESKYRQVTVKIERYNVIGNPQISSLIHYQDLFCNFSNVYFCWERDLNQSTLVSIRMRTINKFNPQNYENLALQVVQFLCLLRFVRPLGFTFAFPFFILRGVAGISWFDLCTCRAVILLPVFSFKGLRDDLTCHLMRMCLLCVFVLCIARYGILMSRFWKVLDFWPTNQGFEAAHKLQRQLYARSTSHDSSGNTSSCKLVFDINFHRNVQVIYNWLLNFWGDNSHGLFVIFVGYCVCTFQTL